MNTNTQPNGDALENEVATPETNEINIEDTIDDASVSASDEESSLTDEIESLKSQLENEKKEYLFLRAEFDNYKKRTLKEKADIIRNGAESAMRGILPIIDDMERAISAMANTDDAQAVKEGIDLIYTKFKKYLEQNGVKEIATNGEDFDTDFHEAIAIIPSPDEKQKGKIIDTTEKGYTLNEKVIRHAKVVVGQ